MQNQKVKSLVDLQKALEVLAQKIEKIERGSWSTNHNEHEAIKNFTIVAEVKQSLPKIQDLFSCFQAEQTAKEQSLRKLLDDGSKEFLNSHRCISSELQIPPWKRDQIREGILKVFDEGSLRKGETDQK